MGFQAYKRRWKHAITSGGIVVDDLTGVRVQSEIPHNLLQDGWLLQHEQWLKGQKTDYPKEWVKLCASNVAGKPIVSNHKRAYKSRVVDKLLNTNRITEAEWEAFEAIIDAK